MPTAWNYIYRRGNIFMRLICARLGHIWSLGPENWYGAADGDQTRTCTCCGRIESRML